MAKKSEKKPNKEKPPVEETSQQREQAPKTPLVDLGSGIFSVRHLGSELLSYLKVQKCTFPTDDRLKQKIILLQDLSYFQRSLILHFLFNSDDINSEISLSSAEDFETPLVRINSYSYSPALYQNGPRDDAPWLTLCLNAIECIKSENWEFENPPKIPQLPEDLLAIPADKGGGVVVLERQFYLTAIEKMISNNPVYTKIGSSNAKTDHYSCQKVLNLIGEKSAFWPLLEEEIHFVNFKRTKLPRFRGQPKLHKLMNPYFQENLSFRPILSGKGGPLSGISQLLDKVLRPIADMMPCRIKDSFDALEKINNVDFEEFSLHTFDATSLYTSFDKELAVKAIKYWASHVDYRKLILPRFSVGSFFEDSIEILFSKNFFSFNGVIYQQTNGLAMGTECAVVLAELILGFLEIKNDLNPPSWWRYIDDALCHLPKNNIFNHKDFILNKINKMDQKIQWTSDPLSKITPFLDLAINQDTGKVSTFHKESAGFACYVPWKSMHPFHMKCNIAFNLFFRAVRINSDQSALLNEFFRIEASLLSLGYPLKVVTKQRDRAKNHNILKRDFTELVPLQIKTIYFTTTRSSVSTSQKFSKMFSQAISLLGNSKHFTKDKVIIKRSFRQPPSCKTRLIWSSLTQKSDIPAVCHMPACKLCKHLFLNKKWKSNCNHTFQVARATCRSRNIVYIIADKITNETLYVGQTCQELSTRMVQHRSGNSWFRTTDFWLIPLQGEPEAVKKIEMEQVLIQTLKPTRNKQKDFFWWQGKSNYQAHNHPTN